MSPAAALLLAAAALPAPAAAVHVVVYPDRARVTRVLEVPCAERARVSFGEVTPAADARTFRGSISEGTVEGVRWEERGRATAFAARAAALDRALLDLDGQITALEQRLVRTENSRRSAAASSPWRSGW